MTAILSPVMRIDLIDIRDAVGGAGALAFTSANGVRSYLAAGGNTDVPAFVVGDATAEVASAGGLASVRSAAGDAASLVTLLAAEKATNVLHIVGRDEAGDLCGALVRQGVSARRVVGYAAEPAERLTAAAVEALQGAGEAWIALFSARSARLFLDLAAAAHLQPYLSQVGAACLSQAVADAAGEGWRTRAIATQARSSALIDAIAGAR